MEVFPWTRLWIRALSMLRTMKISGPYTHLKTNQISLSYTRANHFLSKVRTLNLVKLKFW